MRWISRDVAEELVDLDYQIIGDETVDDMLTQDEANAVEVFQNDAVETAIRAVFLDTSEFDLDPNDIPNHMDDNSTDNSVFVYIPTEDPPQPVESEVEEEEEVAKFLYPAFVHSEVDDEEHGYDVFGEKKDVVVSDEEERLSNDVRPSTPLICTPLTFISLEMLYFDCCRYRRRREGYRFAFRESLLHFSLRT